MDPKQRIRIRMRRQRAALPAALTRRWDQRLQDVLRPALALRPGCVVGLYVPLAGEPELTALRTWITARGGRVVLPVRPPDGDPVSVAAGAGWRWQLAKTLAWTDWHPSAIPPEALGAPRDPDVVILPGLAFDRRGFRLGFGGGVYDRLLTELPGTRWIGVAYDFQVVPRLPVQAWDRPVDVVATPSGLRRTDGGRTQIPKPKGAQHGTAMDWSCSRRDRGACWHRRRVSGRAPDRRLGGGRGRGARAHAGRGG